MTANERSGPLVGVKVIELAGLAPAPFAGMVLADLGADVVRIDRPTTGPTAPHTDRPVGVTDVLGRGRRAVAVDLKSDDGRALVMAMVEEADVLIEGFRPGVMERLGIGPTDCAERNPRLIFGRMTGYGQHGPMAMAAGHDIDYIALSGALHLVGDAGGRPIPPANLVGDFGGGGLLLAVGVLAALVERSRSGLGQVIDAAMVDGAALLSTFLHGQLAAGQWRDERGVNLVDGGAPYYDTYETSDGKYIAVGAIEPQFFAELLDRLGLDIDPSTQNHPEAADTIRAALRERFRARSRDEWAADLQATDACIAPVLSLTEAPHHPHNIERRSFVTVDGVVQPAPAPRFSRTSLDVPSAPPAPGGDGSAALLGWHVDDDLVARAVERAR